MAGKYDISINQGEAYRQRITWLQGDGVTPVNLVGFVGRCQIRASARSGILASPTVTIVDEINGIIEISLTKTQTANLPVTGASYKDTEIYVYDLEMESPLGDVYRVLNGFVYVSPEVTR